MEFLVDITNNFLLLDSYAWCLGEPGVARSVTDGSYVIQDIIHKIINLIKIVIPIALVILGMLDLGKAVMSQKEDDIKKGQSTFLKRLIAAVVVFLVVFVVQVVFNFITPDERDSEGNIIQGNRTMWTCVDQFINGPDKIGVSNTE